MFPPLLSSSPLTSSLRRHPFTYFGLPFILVLVTSSFALSGFTQTRYDLRDQRVTAVTKEEELGMKKGRRKWDVREEYYVSTLLFNGEEEETDSDVESGFRRDCKLRMIWENQQSGRTNEWIDYRVKQSGESYLYRRDRQQMRSEVERSEGFVADYFVCCHFYFIRIVSTPRCILDETCHSLRELRRFAIENGDITVSVVDGVST